MNSVFEILKPEDECLPIKSLSELKSWKNWDSVKYFSHSLRKRASVSDLPKTLVCHDMKGGYLEDRFLNGSETEDNYFFIHWSMIDIFVYFSHHFITIPPCGWISAAHQNGVKILGTFITEWDAGAEICDNILCDIGSVHEICLQLVNIANSYQFDGWLINIENKLTPNKVPLLEEFVKFLTLKMHESQSDSVVIWYDSIITTGELKWQNELNECNRNFFDACDGIFLNYNWNKEKLKKSVKAAGSRKVDVFVGVDVFGRGCPGGGGFSTDIAVTAARDFNLSVAIFAPGWVYECLDVKCFEENQFKFWDSLAELCAPRVMESIPFYTSFCPGYGKKMFRSGKVTSSKPWYNISLQQPQPTYLGANCPTHGSMVSIYKEDAFNGGGCLQMTPNVSKNKEISQFRILKTNFLMETAYCISYTFKGMSEDIKVALVLGISRGKKYYGIHLLEKIDDELQENSYGSCFCCGSSSVLPTSTKVIMGSDENVPWIKRKYKVYCHANESCSIKCVSFHVSCDKPSNPEVSVLLGELLISPILDQISFSYKDLNIMHKDHSSIILECLLEWTLDASIAFSDLYFRVNGLKSYICTTSQFCYRFKGCISNASEIEFMLYPKHSGKNPHPVALKIPLNCDKNSANDYSMNIT